MGADDTKPSRITRHSNRGNVGNRRLGPAGHRPRPEGASDSPVVFEYGQKGLPMVPDLTVFPRGVRLLFLSGVLLFVATFVLLVLVGLLSA